MFPPRRRKNASRKPPKEPVVDWLKTIIGEELVKDL